MLRYIIKRILMIIPVVLVVAVLIFTIMYFSPGDPAEIMLGRAATEEQLQALREELGISGTYLEQLGRFMFNAFIKFDFGISLESKVNVIGELMRRLFSVTLVLAVWVLILEIVIGIPLGMIAAVYRNKWPDHLCMILTILGVSVPAFWIGIELMILFSLKLNLLPTYGIDTWKGWILPIICGSINGVARMARQTRSSMLDAINSDYVKTGRAKGLSEKNLMFRFVLPNAMIPLIQTLGNSFGTSLGGTVIVENLFSLPGVGKYIVDAITLRDYPVIRGSTIVLSTLFCLVMLLVDIGFAFVDPRIKAQYEARGRARKLRRRANA